MRRPLKRPTEAKARAAINRFLTQRIGVPKAQLPSVHMYPDGEISWSFWILGTDTTSYAKADRRLGTNRPFVAIEWYGTEWEPGMEIE